MARAPWSLFLSVGIERLQSQYVIRRSRAQSSAPLSCQPSSNAAEARLIVGAGPVRFRRADATVHGPRPLRGPWRTSFPALFDGIGKVSSPTLRTNVSSSGRQTLFRSLRGGAPGSHDSGKMHCAPSWWSCVSGSLVLCPSSPPPRRRIRSNSSRPRLVMGA